MSYITHLVNWRAWPGTVLFIVMFGIQHGLKYGAAARVTKAWGTLRVRRRAGRAI